MAANEEFADDSTPGVYSSQALQVPGSMAGLTYGSARGRREISLERVVNKAQPYDAGQHAWHALHIRKV